MATQVRLYTIRPEKMAEWLEGWIAGVYPLRRKHGFRIPGAWAIGERNQFLWVLESDGSVEEFAARDRAYYHSEERKTMRPDPAPLLERQETWFVEAVAGEGGLAPRFRDRTERFK